MHYFTQCIIPSSYILIFNIVTLLSHILTLFHWAILVCRIQWISDWLSTYFILHPQPIIPQAYLTELLSMCKILPDSSAQNRALSSSSPMALDSRIPFLTFMKRALYIKHSHIHTSSAIVHILRSIYRISITLDFKRFWL